MGITIVIVAGLTLATFCAAFFDYLGKKKGRNDKAIEKRIDDLEQQIKNLENKADEKDEKIAKLDNDISFLSKLLEDKR